MRFLFKDGSTVYELERLKDMSNLDFNKATVEEVKSKFGDDFEYEIAESLSKRVDLKISNILGNTIWTEKGRYYIVKNYRKAEKGALPEKEVLFYNSGKAIRAVPSSLNLYVPVWEVQPLGNDYDYKKEDMDRVSKVLCKIDPLSFSKSSVDWFSAVVWGSNTVVQSNGNCKLYNLGSNKEQYLKGLQLVGVLNGKPVLTLSKTPGKSLLELDKVLTLIKL